MAQVKGTRLERRRSRPGTIEARTEEEATMAYRIDCADGMTVTGETMDELRKNAEQHVAEHHQGEDLDFEAVMATAREE